MLNDSNRFKLQCSAIAIVFMARFSLLAELIAPVHPLVGLLAPWDYSLAAQTSPGPFASLEVQTMGRHHVFGSGHCHGH